MKKMTLLSIGMVSAMLMLAGCFTRAIAYTKTNPDGTKESCVSILGTGDKVSQVAAEGLFADGTIEDLGAGVKKASAKQESTGIAETFAGVGNMMAGMAQLMAASQGVKTPAAVKAPADSSGETAETDAEIVTETPTATVANAEPKSVISGEGVPVVAILGNRPTCSLCRTLWGRLDAAALSTALCGASIIDADKTSNAAEYARLRPKGAFKYPLVLVYDADGKLAGQFSGAGMTQASLAAKVMALVPSCAATAK